MNPAPACDAPTDVLFALGGNAFAAGGARLTMQGQFAYAEAVAARLLPCVRNAARVLIVHGNGPQVGYILARAEAALGQAYAQPLDVCVAESEGELGYVLLQALRNAWRAQGLTREICALLTQVLVAADDPAFAVPCKPIGRVLAADEAARLRAAGIAVGEDPGRGWRRVVASPVPRAVLELDSIARLLAAGVVVIAAGGGGVPVSERHGRVAGVEAVVDKDATAALLADALDLQTLVMLTDVVCAYTDFRTARERPIGRIGRERLAALAAAGHFAPGSMAPKVAAACTFVDRPGRRAIVCAPDNLTAALAGTDGTRVHCEEQS